MELYKLAYKYRKKTIVYPRLVNSHVDQKKLSKLSSDLKQNLKMEVTFQLSRIYSIEKLVYT